MLTGFGVRDGAGDRVGYVWAEFVELSAVNESGLKEDVSVIWVLKMIERGHHVLSGKTSRAQPRPQVPLPRRPQLPAFLSRHTHH